VQAFFQWAFYDASLHREISDSNPTLQGAPSELLTRKKQENPMKVTMSAPRLKGWLLLASLLVTISASHLGHAQTSVGNIEVCYNCSFDDHGVLDGPIFFIHNTSGSSITNGVLKIGPGGATTDFFNVGTIAAGATAAVEPGLSNDGGSGHTFFQFNEEILDTSDVGPNGDDTQFEFTGLQGSKKVDSGVFTPAATKGRSLDGTVSSINFLGGPGNADGPCNNCFDKTVASLFIPSTFSSTVTLPLQQATTTFIYPNTISTLDHTVDYSASGTNPTGIFMQSTIKWITDSGWGNQFDALLLGTPFQGKKCPHQQIKTGVFACIVTIDVCSSSPSGPFAGHFCPQAATTADFIELTQTFDTDAPIAGPDYIAGTDNALTCTPRFLSPNPTDCRQLHSIFDIITGDPTYKGKTGNFNSLFVPLKQ
jgi:hypothetical protein